MNWTLMPACPPPGQPNHIIKAAEEAAIAIVARLTGENVSPADAARAVKEG